MSKASRLHKKVVDGKMSAKDAIIKALAHGEQTERKSILSIVEEMQDEAYQTKGVEQAKPKPSTDKICDCLTVAITCKKLKTLIGEAQ